MFMFSILFERSSMGSGRVGGVGFGECCVEARFFRSGLKSTCFGGGEFVILGCGSALDEELDDEEEDEEDEPEGNSIDGWGMVLGVEACRFSWDRIPK